MPQALTMMSKSAVATSSSPTKNDSCDGKSSSVQCPTGSLDPPHGEIPKQQGGERKRQYPANKGHDRQAAGPDGWVNIHAPPPFSFSLGLCANRHFVKCLRTVRLTVLTLIAGHTSPDW